MIEQTLRSIGLDSREVTIYLKLLETGSTKAVELAKELSMPKTNVIETLYSLEKRGIVSKTREKNAFIFHPEDPEILLLNVDKKVEELQASKEELKKALPLIKAKKEKNSAPTVKYFEGKEGLLQLYEDTLKSKTEIYAYGSSEDEMQCLSGYFPEYWNKRKKANIPLIGLMPDTEFNKKHSSNTDKEHIRTTYLYPQEYRTPLEIDVYDNKVVLMSFKEMFGVMIESNIIADAMRNILKLAKDGIVKKQ